MQKNSVSLTRISNHTGGAFSSRPLSKTDYSLIHLQAMNKKIEGQSKQAMNFLEELKKQRSMQNKTTKAVGLGIQRVEQSGVYFASRLEQEKTKNNNLEALVKFYEEMLYQDKKIRYEEQKGETKRLVPFLKKTKQQKDQEKEQVKSREKQLYQLGMTLKNLERTYEDLILKTNTSSYELSKKMDQVRVLRSERTVRSGLFDQFEHQIFDHELLYKKLVIERTVLESIFLQKVQEFGKMEHETRKHCEKLLSNNKKMLLEDQTQRRHTIQTQQEFIPEA